MQFAYFMTRHVDDDGVAAKVLHIPPRLEQWSRPMIVSFAIAEHKLSDNKRQAK